MRNEEKRFRITENRNVTANCHVIYVRTHLFILFLPPFDLYLQLQASNDVKVLLKKLNLKSGGLYRCEISAEAPNFSSVEGEGRMEIVCKYFFPIFLSSSSLVADKNI